MLISERIVKEKNFLWFPSTINDYPRKIDIIDWYSDLRKTVMGAEKFVIPDYMAGTFYGDGDKNILKKLVDDGHTLTEITSSRSIQYAQFSVCPFPVITIENNNVCYVVKQKEDGFIVIIVDKNGLIIPVSHGTDGIFEDETGKKGYNIYMYFHVTEIARPFDFLSNFNTTKYQNDREILEFSRFSLVCLYCVFEILLYINAKNRRQVEVFAPIGQQKKNSKKAALQKGIVYKVLVLDKSKPTLVNTKDVANYIYSPEEEHAKRRATYVRGHLKVRKTGTYWWNPFIRDAKNALTVGMVDKTYDVKIPQT